MTASAPIWRCFSSLPSDSEAAAVSAHCVFSLSTLEIACDSGTDRVALVEQEHHALWRWAILGDTGVIERQGQQPTQADAKRAAAEALALMIASSPSNA